MKTDAAPEMTHDRKTIMIEMFWFFHHDSTTSVRMTQMSAVLYTSSTILDIAKKNTKNCWSWMELRNWKHKCQHQTNHFVCQWFLKFFFWNMSPYRLHPKHHEREEHANYHVFQSQDFDCNWQSRDSDYCNRKTQCAVMWKRKLL